MRISKIFILLLAIALLLSCAGLAEQNADLNHALSIHIQYTPDDAPAADAQFDLYKVASMDGNGTFKLLPPYDGYGLDLGSGNEEQLIGLAATLQGYVLHDNLDSDFSGYTNESGELRFSDGIRPGLYLLLGRRHCADGLIYTPQPALLQLPFRDPISDEWGYALSISIKYDTEMDMDEPLRLKVLKVWNDEGYEHKRPYGIMVHLLCDGEIHDIVELCEENNWRHTWENLEANHQWNVTEEAALDYSHIIAREGITFVITNTYQTPAPTATAAPTPTPAPDDPTPTPGPDDPTPPPGTDEPTPTPTKKPDKPDNPKLPQTGQYWWPVPMLISVGLLLIILGLIRRRRSDYEE